MQLSFQTKVPGTGMHTRPVDMNFDYAQDFGNDTLPDAYERLLLDAIQGDASLFARSDEIETAWGIIDPIIQTWKETNQPPIFFYESGEWGPVEASQLLAQDGRQWHVHSLFFWQAFRFKAERLQLSQQSLFLSPFLFSLLLSRLSLPPFLFSA